MLSQGEARLALSNLLQMGGAAIAAAVAGHGAARAEGRTRRHLLALMFAALAWASGQAYWTFSEVVLDRPVPFPSPADAGFLLTYPFLIAALASSPPSRIHRSSLARWALDGMTIGLGVFFVAWSLVLPELLESHSTLEDILAISYPVSDLLVLLASLLAFTRVAATWRWSLTSLALGAWLLCLADLGFAYLNTTAEYATGSIVDLGWVLAWPVIALGATAVPREGLATGSSVIEPPGRVSSVLPEIAIAAVVALVVLRLVEDPSSLTDPVLLWSGVLLASLAIGRGVAARAESRALESALSARIQAESALATRFQLAVDGAGIATWSRPLNAVVGSDLRVAEIFGLDSGPLAELLEAGDAVIDAAEVAPIEAAFSSMRAADAPLAFDFRTELNDSSQMWLQARGRRASGNGGPGLLGVMIDASPRYEIQRLLIERATHAEAVAAFGGRVLVQELARTLQDAAETVTTVLAAETCHVLRLDESEGTMRAAAGVGPGVAIHGSVVASAGPEELPGFALTSREPVFVDPGDEDLPFLVPARLRPTSTDAMVTAAIPLPVGHWGAIVAARRGLRAFTLSEGDFAQAIATLVAAAAQRAVSEQALLHESLHDALTGLANRAALNQKIRELRVDASRGATLFYIDVDNFATINAERGYALGDRVLQHVARVLSECAGPRDTVARVSSDEFAILVGETLDADATAQVARSVLAAVAASIEPEASFAHITVSIGSAHLSGPGEEGYGSLLRNAGLAMEAARSRGRGIWEDYTQAMYDEIELVAQTRSELLDALERQELVVHYQPVVDLRTGTISGAEALVRWDHPERGLVPPDEFLPVAEKAGLMPEITRLVLDAACLWAASNLDVPGLS
ncbi:MAG: diguanylate cyclase domain-containing protein, partial [Acidimicrobiia bacterium]